MIRKAFVVEFSDTFSLVFVGMSATVADYITGNHGSARFPGAIAAVVVLQVNPG